MSRLTITPENVAAVRLLCDLWDTSLVARCGCKEECRTYRETHNTGLPVGYCSRGKLTIAVDLIGPQLPEEWPDEWDEEFQSLVLSQKRSTSVGEQDRSHTDGN